MRSYFFQVVAVLSLLSSCNSTEDSRQKAIDLNNQGVQLRHTDADKASALFKESISIDSTSPAAYNNLAGVYVEKGDYKNATNIVESLVHVKPDLAEAVFFLGMLKEKLGERDIAQALYEKSILLFDGRIKQGDKYLLANRANHAVALIFVGREQEGRDEIKRILPEFPSDSPMIEVLTNLDKEKYLQSILGGAP